MESQTQKADLIIPLCDILEKEKLCGQKSDQCLLGAGNTVNKMTERGYKRTSGSAEILCVFTVMAITHKQDY